MDEKRLRLKAKYVIVIIGAGVIFILAVVSVPLLKKLFARVLMPSLTPYQTFTSPLTALPTPITDPKSVQMVLVPEGEFTMGSDFKSDEGPIRQIFLDTYYIDKYEVTNTLYKACADAGVCDLPIGTAHYDNSKYAQHPVVNVDWKMAQAYCEWRSARLPTEAEWEKASRGTDGRTYPWGERIEYGNRKYCSYANYYYDENNVCVGDTTIVGSYEDGKSPYGAYDMGGNVFEWVADRYLATNTNYLYSSDFRVIRGGSWTTVNYLMRSAYRSGKDPSFTSDALGFRCALSP